MSSSHADVQLTNPLQGLESHPAGGENPANLWQKVAADNWTGFKPSESQLNKPVELSSIPLTTSHQRAEQLADASTYAGRSGMFVMPNEGDVMHGGPATEAIFRKISDATRGLQGKEIEATKGVFNNLPPSEQAAVAKEAQMRHVQLLDSGRDATPTPHYDAYLRSVEKAIAPFEQERTAIAKKVLADLPKDLVHEKQQEDFFHQHIKAL
jgi:hypothetical protein